MKFITPLQKIRTDKAVIIFPGGDTNFLAYDWEGTDFMKALEMLRNLCLCTQIQTSTSPSIIDPKLAPLQDAQRLIRLVKANLIGGELTLRKLVF